MRLVEIGLKELNSLVARAADLSVEAFDTALNAIKEKNKEEKRLKVKELVRELRRLREEIDELSLEIIARYQPVASELRRVKAAMELGYAFLRFGRYSYDALAAFSRAEKLGIDCESKYFDEMAPIVMNMMQDAIKAIKDLDVITALKVISKDDEVESVGNTGIYKIPVQINALGFYFITIFHKSFGYSAIKYKIVNNNVQDIMGELLTIKENLSMKGFL